MSKTLLRVLLTAALLASGFGFMGAAADTASAPAALAVAQAPLVQVAAIVCGGNGCNPIHTKIEKKRKFQTLGHG